MIKYITFLTFAFYLAADTTFITPMEYASQLYKNPRGIGCHHCHGDDGEGKIVARYIDKNKKKVFKGPAINHMKYQKFFNALNKRNNGMPRYFLTIKEIEALYLYLHRDDRLNSKNKRVLHAK
jgi:mono/diheme cytochrome c family protein